jgi:hypothetical protein
MQNLPVTHLGIDECWTYVQKKQARLTIEEKALRHDIGDVYLWTAVDKETKLVATFALGKRSADMARRFMVDIAKRLPRQSPHASDAHAYQPAGYLQTVQITTDGFAAYPGGR